MTTVISKDQEALEKADVVHGLFGTGEDDKDDFLICSFTEDGKLIIPPPSEGTNK